MMMVNVSSDTFTIVFIANLTALQYVAFYRAKGRVLACKRPSFIS